MIIYVILFLEYSSSNNSRIAIEIWIIVVAQQDSSSSSNNSSNTTKEGIRGEMSIASKVVSEMNIIMEMG